ncbi:MAG: ParB/RepB/Spo0J family partition protein [Bacillota bacterium]|nr:ParB/RepB/Spo0J family partition protein [Bacillota bacterium]
MPNRYRAGTAAVLLRLPADLKCRGQELVRQWSGGSKPRSLNHMIQLMLENAVETVRRRRDAATALELDPRALRPTQGAEETLAGGLLDGLIEEIKRSGRIDPLEVFECDGSYYILDGHRRAVAAAALGRVTVPVAVVFGSDDTLPWGESVRRFVARLPLAGYQAEMETLVERAKRRHGG